MSPADLVRHSFLAICCSLFIAITMDTILLQLS